MAQLTETPIRKIADLLLKKNQINFWLSCKKVYSTITPHQLYPDLKIEFPLNSDSVSKFHVGKYCKNLRLVATHNGQTREWSDFMIPSTDETVSTLSKELISVESLHCTFDYNFCPSGIPRILQILNELPSPSKLKSIILEPYSEAYSSAWKLDPAFISHIQRFSNLKTVILWFVQDFNTVLEVIRTWPNLRNLHLSQKYEDGGMLETLDESIKLPYLQSLVLFGFSCSQQTANFVKSLNTATSSPTPDNSTHISSLKRIHMFLNDHDSEYSTVTGTYVRVSILSPTALKQQVQDSFPLATVEVRTEFELGDYLLNYRHAKEVFLNRKWEPDNQVINRGSLFS
ncbi:hypothetical protein HK098_006103 [Nowakowskiella sp. JEL0407]|nr:hypothetical protein HK098_006103 [Nowakowskiella sp. JEL0407]